MGEENENGGGLAVIPAALIERTRAFQLSDGRAITLKRWSLVRTAEIAKFVADTLRELTGLQGKQIPAGEIVKSMKIDVFLLLEKLPHRALGLLQLAVEEPDRKTIGEVETEDAVDILQNAIELNFTDRLKKKAMGLALGSLMKGEE